MWESTDKIISAKTKSSAKPRRSTKSSALRVAAHDARKTEAGQKLVRVWVPSEHVAALRHYAQALNASRPGAKAGLIKAAAWASSEALDAITEHVPCTVYGAPGPLDGMEPLYRLEAIGAVLRGAKK